MKKIVFMLSSLSFILHGYAQPYLYGTTEWGGIGDNGVVYSYNVATNTYSKVLEFYGDNGFMPIGKLVLGSDQKIYGVTQMGGTPIFGRGVIYSIDPLTNTRQILYSILEESIPGQLIYASPTLFYSNNDTAIYKFNTVTHEFDQIYSFHPNGPDERFLGSLTVANNGNLYGVRAFGQDNYLGELISFNPNTSIFTIEFEFDQGPDVGTVNGSFANGDLILGPNGLLYGSAGDGGSHPGRGVIFTFDPATSIYSVRYTFTSSGPLGEHPGSLKNGIDGKMYGYTSVGGAFDWGTAFSYSPANNTVTKLTDLDQEFYSRAPNRMLIASDGNFYSTTRNQGATNEGSLFTFLTSTRTYQTLLDFEESVTDMGRYPVENSLIEVSKGYSITCPGNQDITAGPNCATVVTGIDPVVFPASAQVSYTLLNPTTGGDVIGQGLGSVSGMSFNRFQTKVIYSIVNQPNTSCSFIVNVIDKTPPVLTVADSIFHCYEDMTWPGSRKYYVPPAQAFENCAPAVAYRYVVKNKRGRIIRTGTSNNASGWFDEGRNLVVWKVFQLDGGNAPGHVAYDTTIVQINPEISADLMVHRPIQKGVDANTLYLGYFPASIARLGISGRSCSPGSTYVWTVTGNAVSFNQDPHHPAFINLKAVQAGSSIITVELTDVNGCKLRLSKNFTVEDVRCGPNLDKVQVCKPATHHSPSINLCVSKNAVAALLHAGRKLGSCNDCVNTIVNETKTMEEFNGEGITLVASPNPSALGFKIYITSNRKEAMNLRVTDVAGRIIEQKENILPGSTINIGENYQPGIYICEVEQQGTRKQARLVKQGN